MFFCQLDGGKWVALVGEVGGDKDARRSLGAECVAEDGGLVFVSESYPGIEDDDRGSERLRGNT